MINTNTINKKSDKRINAIYFIVITIFIDSLGLGIFIPIFPSLMQEITHESIGKIAIYSGWMIFIYSIMQFIFAPILGSLSDKYGRKPVLILSLAALGVDYIFMALANSLVFLFIARTISGIMGSSFTTASAFIADISDDKTRTRNFGYMQAAFGAGFIFGPVIGGLLGQFGTRFPFFFAAGITLLNVLFGIFIVPETLKERYKAKFSLIKSNPINSLLYFSNNKKIMIFTLIFFMLYLGVSAFHNVWNFYLIEKFNWGSEMIGYALGIFGISMFLFQGFLTKPITSKLGDAKTAIYGLALCIIVFFIIAFNNSGFVMIAIASVFELGWIGVTALTSIAAKQVSSIDQGKMQGLYTSVMSITNIIGPLIMTGSFSLFTVHNKFYYFPGIPFLIGGLLTLIALIIVIYMFQSDKKLAQSKVLN